MDVEIKTIKDSDKYTRPFCTLVLKKKAGQEKLLA
jgi:hypothetical protein